MVTEDGPAADGVAKRGIMAERSIDLRKLRRTVAARQAARPGGRVPTGAMALVRANLAAFDELRAGGATWAEIAAGLAEQGMTQGDGEPITAKRLTALVTLVRKADVARAAKASARQGRGDLVGEPKADAKRTRDTKLRLAAELAPSLPTAADHGPSEGDLRREAFDRHDHLFKKD
jgi:hypothetical protein